uniref:Uncharacterized protein n=1 Tax=Nelumbo nucifera TaxID=4432 RepID=A0A822XZV4_NELNU|nr:TPA_asm: hypothetical protein HUJ06_026000 [Nelumbo nucifera]
MRIFGSLQLYIFRFSESFHNNDRNERRSSLGSTPSISTNQKVYIESNRGSKV